MSDEALIREAERCRRLTRQATDRRLAAVLEAIALEYEARTFSSRPQDAVSAETLAAVRRAV